MPESKTYIATRPSCGHVVVAVVNRPEDAKDIAKMLAKCAKDGYEISLVETAWVRKDAKFCDCPKKKKTKQQDLFAL